MKTNGLHKGEGYYQNIWVFWNQASFGVTENFSLGFGIIPLFLFGGEAGQYSPIWVVPKLSYPWLGFTVPFDKKKK